MAAKATSEAATLNWQDFYIGRRSRKKILAGKTIRRNSEGFEIFDDYLSDEDEVEENTPFVKHTPDNQKKNTGKTDKTSDLSASKNVLTPANRRSRICKSQNIINKSSRKSNQPIPDQYETPKNQSSLSVSRRLITPVVNGDSSPESEKSQIIADGCESSASLSKSMLKSSTKKNTQPELQSPEIDDSVNCTDKSGVVLSPDTPATASDDDNFARSATFSEKRSASVTIQKSETQPKYSKLSDASLPAEVSPKEPNTSGNELNVTDVDCSGIISPSFRKNASSAFREITACQSNKKASKQLTTSVELSDSDSEGNFQFVSVNSNKKVTRKSKNKANALNSSITNKMKSKNGITKAKNKMKTQKETSASKNIVKSTVKKYKKAPIYPVAQPVNQQDDENLRRSKRTRLPCLEYWKQERPIYRRTSSGVAIVGVQSPVSKVPLHQAHKKTQAKAPTKSKPNIEREDEGAHQKDENMFDQNTYTGTKVVNPSTREEEIEMCIGDVDPPSFGPSGTKDTSDPFSVTKLFVNHLFTAGYINLKPLAEKPRSRNEEYTILYSIVRGKLEVTIHETTYLLKSGNIFVIPKGNSYAIRNVQKAKAVLQYTCITGSDYSFDDSDADSGSQ